MARALAWHEGKADETSQSRSLQKRIVRVETIVGMAYRVVPEQ